MNQIVATIFFAVRRPLAYAMVFTPVQFMILPGGVEAELLAQEGAGHGFKGQEAEKARKAMLAFLAKHLEKS